MFNLIYSCEEFNKIEEEIKDLSVIHWNEVSENKDEIPLSLDFEIYNKLQDNGALRCFTVRDNGTLIGYAIFILQYNLHHKDFLFASNDSFFVLKEYRGLEIGSCLLKFTEDYLIEDNVSVIHIHTKVKHPLDKLLESEDFICEEKVYSKVIN